MNNHQGIEFSHYRLGSLWFRVGDLKKYRLRRLTDSKTLQGTLYMWCPDDGECIFDLTVDKWVQA